MLMKVYGPKSQDSPIAGVAEVVIDTPDREKFLTFFEGSAGTAVTVLRPVGPRDLSPGLYPLGNRQITIQPS